MNFLPFINFITYFVSSLLALGVFMFIYEKFTPYREYDEIKQGNLAASIAFGGAIVGFVIPLCASIYFTHSLIEMLKWAVVVGVVQIVTYTLIQRLHGFGDCVKDGKVPGAIFLACVSVAVGMLNAVSISY